MTPAEVKAIRDQVGGTRAMAVRLELTDRAVRSMCQKGIKRRSTEKQVRTLLNDELATLQTKRNQRTGFDPQ